MIVISITLQRSGNKQKKQHNDIQQIQTGKY